MLADILNNILKERNIELTFGPFFVLQQLVEHDYKRKGKKRKGKVWPSMDRLVEVTHMCERAVRDHIRELENRKLITTKQRGYKKSNMYIFTFCIDDPSTFPIEEPQESDRQDLPVKPQSDRQILPPKLNHPSFQMDGVASAQKSERSNPVEPTNEVVAAPMPIDLPEVEKAKLELVLGWLNKDHDSYKATQERIAQLDILMARNGYHHEDQKAG